MTKILLADPLLIGQGLEMNYPNLGLLYIISCLRQEEAPLEVAYLPGVRSKDQYVRTIASFRPDIVGLSFTSLAAPIAYETARIVRGIVPACLIVSGGAHSTVSPEEVLQESEIDVCVLGEGENTFLDLVRQVRAKGSPAGVRGIAYLEDGQLRRNPNRDLFGNLDDIPFPAWDLVDFREFLGPTIRQRQPATALLTSRGCPFHCGFCSNPVWRLNRPWMRKRSPANIAREVQVLYRRGIREIYIRADEFNVAVDWAIDVCGAIRRLGLRNLSFQCNLTVPNISEDLARALKSINVWLVHIGIESANQRVLNGIKKRQTVRQVLDACRILKAQDLSIFGFFMMFQAWEQNGEVWYETAAEVRNTLAFVKYLIDRRLLDYMSWQFATPLPGAPLYDVAAKYRLIPTEENAYRPANMWGFNMSLPGVSLSEMKMLRLRGMCLQVYLALRSGRINWRHVGKIKNKVRLMLKSV